MHWIYAHFIGDYIFQNDWMALNKKKSSTHCLSHIVAYMLPFLLCGFAWWQLVLIAIQHYAIDRSGFVKWLCEAKGSASFIQPPMAPWSLIVVDNVLHILWIAFVAWLPHATWDVLWLGAMIGILGFVNVIATANMRTR